MAPILEMKNISKQFPGVLANDNVCLSVEKGEVHALLGENGAGKSTLMSVLCGLYKPTKGEIFINGNRVEFQSAKDAMKIGIGMVHQHFMLIPTLTVVENIMIGLKDGNPMYLDIKEAAKKIEEFAKKYNMNIDPMTKVQNLTVGQRQRVEIIKVLFRGSEIIILDEPTAVLTPQETNELFVMIRELISNGYTILFISHKLNEVKEISDRVTVLRQGQSISTHQTADCSTNDLARLMVGRAVNFQVDKCEAKVGKTVLSVNNLGYKQDNDLELLHDLTFDVREGEILGIAGVDGNGQSELVSCLTGLLQATSGNIRYFDKDITHSSTREIMKTGISHIPEDRQHSGLILSMELSENFILQDYYQDTFGKGAFLDWKFINEHSDKLIRDFNIKAPGYFELAQNLSGGNQQKVIFAREVFREPKLLIAMHPTRGIDVGAIEYIHKKMVEYRDMGMAILLVSTELEEVMKLSDRVCVMYEGEFMGFVNPQDVTVEEIGLMMGGQRQQQGKAIN